MIKNKPENCVVVETPEAIPIISKDVEMAEDTPMPIINHAIEASKVNQCNSTDQEMTEGTRIPIIYDVVEQPKVIQYNSTDKEMTEVTDVPIIFCVIEEPKEIQYNLTDEEMTEDSHIPIINDVLEPPKVIQQNLNDKEMTEGTCMPILHDVVEQPKVIQYNSTDKEMTEVEAPKVIQCNLTDEEMTEDSRIPIINDVLKPPKVIQQNLNDKKMTEDTRMPILHDVLKQSKVIQYNSTDKEMTEVEAPKVIQCNSTDEEMTEDSHIPIINDVVEQPKVIQYNSIDKEMTEDTRMPIINDVVEQPKVIQYISTDKNITEDMALSKATFRYVFNNFTKNIEKKISPPFYCRGLPWKILIMYKKYQGKKTKDTPVPSLAYFLQCNGDSKSTSWCISASAVLRVISQKEGVENVERKIQHFFSPKLNDWGFTHFMPWANLAAGYIENDTIICEVSVTADVPLGVGWNSKKHTGFVGLKNQGSTCYMNSLLQTLYFTNQLREAVYKMPIESCDSNMSFSLALQRLFHELQFSDMPVHTKYLTKSFGWETLDILMQHDVQEFLRILLDQLENKMKGTCVEATIPQLFQGKMISYINCKNVDYTSERIETFYDIQLNIIGKENIYESFKDYIKVDLLDGVNKYDAREYGLQDAEKGVMFMSFPPVIHLHLMRIQYDPVKYRSIKSNDRFEFYDKINLDEYLKVKEDTPADYVLHAVLVHSGDNSSGHYVVFIDPEVDGKWCKFDDDIVSRCSKEEAIENNFGGTEENMNMMSIQNCTNAYMLVYIRVSEIKNVLQKITIHNIPKELEEKLQEEKHIEDLRRQVRNEMYTSIKVFLEESFDSYSGVDLFNIQDPIFIPIRVKKTNTLEEVYELLAQSYDLRLDLIRIWSINGTKHASFRPMYVDRKTNALKTVQDLQDESATSWNIWLETVEPDEHSLLPFDKDSQCLVFLKFFMPEKNACLYFGYYFAPYSVTINSLTDILKQRADFTVNLTLVTYTESTNGELEKITRPEKPISEVVQNLTYGIMLYCVEKNYLENLPLSNEWWKFEK